MEIKNVIQSQFHASLSMLEEAVVHCPVSMWDAQEDKNKFWHIAYHTLFYTHFYLQHTEADFIPWTKLRAEYHFMGPTPWPPHNVPEIGEPYSKEDILEYCDFCRTQVDEQIPALQLDAESGFSWLPFNKLELQLYSIRHLQHHTGELCERLGARAGIEVRWVGMKLDA